MPSSWYIFFLGGGVSAVYVPTFFFLKLVVFALNIMRKIKEEVNFF